MDLYFLIGLVRYQVLTLIQLISLFFCNNLKKGLANYDLLSKSILMPVFANRVLLEHIPMHLCIAHAQLQ